MSNKILSDKIAPLPGLIADHIACFASQPITTRSNKGLKTILQSNWEKLRSASGAIVQGLMQEIDKKYAEHAPNSYKLFSELHQKLAEFKPDNPPEYLTISRRYKGSLSHQRFIALGEMVETSYELRKIWDRIEPYIDVKLPGNGQRNFYVALWFKDSKSQTVLDMFAALDLCSLKLTRFPQAVFKFRNLVTLGLRNNPIARLPINEMRGLPKLFSLDLGATSISKEEETVIASELPKVLPKLGLCIMNNISFSTYAGRDLRSVWPVICQALGSTPELHFATWFTDENNHVRLLSITKLDLSGKNLSHLSKELFHCKNLELLNLRNNNITAELQTAYAKNMFIGFPKLQKLHLDIGSFVREPPEPVERPHANVAWAPPKAATPEKSKCVVM